MFSCEICEMFKNIFFHRTPPVAASAYSVNTWMFFFSFSDLTKSQISSIGFSLDWSISKQRTSFFLLKIAQCIRYFSISKTFGINNYFDFCKKVKTMLLFLTNHFLILAFLHAVVGHFDAAVCREWYLALSIEIAAFSGRWGRSASTHHLSKRTLFISWR